MINFDALLLQLSVTLVLAMRADFNPKVSPLSCPNRGHIRGLKPTCFNRHFRRQAKTVKYMYIINIQGRTLGMRTRPAT
ncbi:hypothetical protein F4808DRAFT_302017 [Astrocystis sublimbata]|nr:hypothetical protein F4808DRAFT_302017 [Astrocystis sublimbata]